MFDFCFLLVGHRLKSDKPESALVGLISILSGNHGNSNSSSAESQTRGPPACFVQPAMLLGNFQVINI